MTPGRTVYIPNRVFHDYTDAKQYGRLTQLSQGSIDSMNLDDIESRFRAKLSKSHRDDFILMSGSPMLNVIAALVQMERHGIVRLLQWDGVLKEYNLFTLQSGPTSDAAA